MYEEDWRISGFVYCQEYFSIFSILRCILRAAVFCIAGGLENFLFWILSGVLQYFQYLEVYSASSSILRSRRPGRRICEGDTGSIL